MSGTAIACFQVPSFSAPCEILFRRRTSSPTMLHILLIAGFCLADHNGEQSRILVQMENPNIRRYELNPVHCYFLSEEPGRMTDVSFPATLTAYCFGT